MAAGQAGAVRHLESVGDDHDSPLLQAVFEASPLAMGIAEVDERGVGSIIRVNSAYTSLLGYSREEFLGRGDDLLHPEDARATRVARRRLATGQLSKHVSEVRIRRSDDSYIWARMSRVTVPDRSGEVRYVLAIVDDITNDKHREWELERRVFTDPLTGLVNRAGLIERLSLLLSRPVQSKAATAVALIDLDGFKAINDRFGHRTGDEVLIAVARVLDAAVRPADLVARLGGDEFVVVAEVASPEEGCRLGRRLGEEVSSALRHQGHEGCSGSVGTVVVKTGDTPTSVLERADHAMYAVKRQRTARLGGPSTYEEEH